MCTALVVPLAKVTIRASASKVQGNSSLAFLVIIENES
jgi:hypothetical protein